MNWLTPDQSLTAHLAEAEATFRQLGHAGTFTGWFPEKHERAWIAVCNRCGARAQVRGDWHHLALSGTGLELRCVG